jgi:inner membrane protein
MPSAFAHAATALALIPGFHGAGTPARLWVAGALCAAAPDLDVVAFWLGVPYAHPLGHRGLSHSLAFAAVFGALLGRLLLPPGLRVRGALYLFLATASHGVLDTFTSGGLGVALLAPFDDTRLFAPFRPIRVSPIGAGAFLERGAAVLENELVTVFLPCALLGALLAIGRRISRAR